MIKLSNPEARRGFRAVIEGIVSLVAIGLVGWVIHLLRDQAAPLERIAQALIALTALGTAGYVLENVTRAFKLSVGPGHVDVQAGPDVAEPGGAAQTVADAAQGQADAVKAVTQ